MTFDYYIFFVLSFIFILFSLYYVEFFIFYVLYYITTAKHLNGLVVGNNFYMPKVLGSTLLHVIFPKYSLYLYFYWAGPSWAGQVAASLARPEARVMRKK
jgi:hypothetical protein